MNKFFTFAAAIGLLGSCTLTFATEAKPESVEQLLEISNADQMVENSRRYMHDNIKKMPRQMQILPEHRDIATKYMRQMTKLVETQVQWSKVKAPITEVYTSIFSEEEIQGLIEFYQTDLGKKLIEKTPELMAESMKTSQQLMSTLTPQLQKLQQDMINEIKQLEMAKQQPVKETP